MFLHEWAARWNIPLAAIQELQAECGEVPLPDAVPRSETAVSNDVRLKAGKQGWPLWRNNVGAGTNQDGQFIRYGLANESENINKVFKSCDLIGCRPILITPDLVGRTFGQFVGLEVKKAAWQFTGTGREVAQANFIRLVLKNGGYARFINSPEQLP